MLGTKPKPMNANYVQISQDNHSVPLVITNSLQPLLKPENTPVSPVEKENPQITDGSLNQSKITPVWNVTSDASDVPDSIIPPQHAELDQKPSAKTDTEFKPSTTQKGSPALNVLTKTLQDAKCLTMVQNKLPNANPKVFPAITKPEYKDITTEPLPIHKISI